MSSLVNVINRLFWAGLLALSLAACSTSFRSEVVSFHKLPSPSGERVSIIPLKDEMSAGLEFEQYANLIGARLGTLGYSSVGTGEADLIVKIDYRVSEGRDRTRQVPGGRMGLTYYYPHSFNYGHGYSFHPFASYFGPSYAFGYGIGHGYNDYPIYTVYTRSLEMKIETTDGEILFEGRSVSEGRGRNLPEIMPFLVEAMFTNFPGESGVTRTVRVELEDGSNY